jgi:hypothetical protein
MLPKIEQARMFSKKAMVTISRILFHYIYSCYFQDNDHHTLPALQEYVHPYMQTFIFEIRCALDWKWWYTGVDAVLQSILL